MECLLFTIHKESIVLESAYLSKETLVDYSVFVTGLWRLVQCVVEYDMEFL